MLLPEEDSQALEETLYLLSIPGMRESILEGMNTPIEECDTELDWWRVVSMKLKRNIGLEILKGIQEIKAHKAGKVVLRTSKVKRANPPKKNCANNK